MSGNYSAIAWCVLILLAFLAIPAFAQNDSSAATAASSNNAIGFDLLNELNSSTSTGKNVFLSPISITQALGMLAIGASGKTKEEIIGALHLDDGTTRQIEESNLLLLSSLKSTDSSVSLSIANAIWSQSGRTFSPAYIADAAKYFSAEAQSVDFTHPAIAAASINAWVNKNTEGKIPELVSPESIDNAASVLTNAVYFKGVWAAPFDPDATAPADFTLDDGSNVQLPTMHRAGEISCYFDQGITMLSLLYSGTPSTSMIVILPPVGQPLRSFVSTLNADELDGWISELSPKNIRLSMPKFHVEYSAELTDPLESLGVETAFTRGADLSPMGFPNNFVSAVIHKAVIDVDEHGTVAAGATGIVMRSLAIAAPRVVQIDRPFICAIRDDSTGALLVLGAIGNPLSGQ